MSSSQGAAKTSWTKPSRTLGDNVCGVQGDASNLADLDRLYETVQREKKQLDILFASAGQDRQALLGSVTEEEFDTVFDLNVRGTLFTVQKALPLFRDGGSIILNGSIASVKAMPGRSVYGASKAAVRAFARTWLVELQHRGIRVNVLSPGPIYISTKGWSAEKAHQYEAMVPRRELGRPEEVASAALFLASSDSSFVNGLELFVDGGITQI